MAVSDICVVEKVVTKTKLMHSHFEYSKTKIKSKIIIRKTLKKLNTTKYAVLKEYRVGNNWMLPRKRTNVEKVSGKMPHKIYSLIQICMF